MSIDIIKGDIERLNLEAANYRELNELMSRLIKLKKEKNSLRNVYEGLLQELTTLNTKKDEKYVCPCLECSQRKEKETKIEKLAEEKRKKKKEEVLTFVPDEGFYDMDEVEEVDEVQSINAVRVPDCENMYRDVDRGFIIKESANGAILTVIEVEEWDGKSRRPLTEREKKIALNLGLRLDEN